MRLKLKPFGIRAILIESEAIKTGFDGIALVELRQMTTLDAYRGTAEAFGGARMGPERAPAPEIVVRAVQRAIEAKKPRARYIVSNDSCMFILVRRLLGNGSFDRLISGQLGGSGGMMHAPSPQASERLNAAFRL
jgi:hypothetical protein